MFNEQISKLFTKQKMMRTVIISTIPLILSSIYFFGWRVFLLLIAVTIFGVLTEYVFEKKTIKKYQKLLLLHLFYTH